MTPRPLFNLPLHALPMAREMAKLAQLPEPPPDSGEAPAPEESTLPSSGKLRPKNPILHALGAVMGPAVAFGAGSAAGYGAQLGAEKLFRLGPGAVRPLRAAAPVLGGAMGLALQQYKSRENQELRRALEAHRHQSTGVSE